MARKNPPGQTEFLATALEQELLALIGKGGSLTAEAIAGRFPNADATRNALEGCRAKRFVTQDGSGHLALTDAGRKQI